ncbi:MAG: hypothetical protein J0H71_20870 [Rhizobiales bacterium]|nr:hypothetical protein [Hyphomicrobiales bacterium]
MRVSIKVVLAAVILSSPLAFARTSMAATASRAVQAEFDGFIAKFRAALNADDSAAVTSMTRLPFEYRTSYPDAAAFRAKAYPVIFRAKVRTCIGREKAVYDRDGENNDSFFIFCGQEIFIFTKTASGFLFKEIGTND